MAGDGRGCGHDRAYQMCPAVLPLAAFEIPVRSAGGSLAGREYVRIHGEAHAATCIAPFESGVTENLVEAFGFRLRLDGHRAGHHQRFLEILGDVLAGDDARRGPKVVQARHSCTIR